MSDSLKAALKDLPLKKIAIAIDGGSTELNNLLDALDKLERIKIDK